MHVLFEVVDRVIEERMPSSSRPTRRMCPPTQIIAAIPTFERTDKTTGMACTSPRPNEAAGPSRVCASRRPTSSIFTISATAP